MHANAWRCPSCIGAHRPLLLQEGLDAQAPQAVPGLAAGDCRVDLRPRPV
jgi:AhpD family alkylhydroperoxidase